MDSIFNIIFHLLLLTKITIGEVTKRDNISVSMADGGATLDKTTDGSTSIYDATATSFLVKYKDSVYVRRMDQFLLKDAHEVSIGTGYSLMRKHSDGSTRLEEGLLKLAKSSGGIVTVDDGYAAQIQKHLDTSTLIKDGQLILQKKLDGTVCINGAGSACVTKIPNQWTDMIAGYSNIRKYSDGSMTMFDGLAAYLEKYSDGSIRLQNTNAYITKNAEGSINVWDDEATLLKNSVGTVEMYVDDYYIGSKSDGGLTIMDNTSSMSIMKESSAETSTNTAVSKIVEDRNGIQIILQLTEQETKNLEVRIIGHVLYAKSTTARPISIKARLPNRIREDDVQMCFLSDGTVIMLIDRKKQSISCPQDAIRSESLEKFQTSLLTSPFELANKSDFFI